MLALVGQGRQLQRKTRRHAVPCRRGSAEGASLALVLLRPRPAPQPQYPWRAFRSITPAYLAKSGRKLAVRWCHHAVVSLSTRGC